MKYSIGQAATKTRKSKSTISRAISTGRLSATNNGDAKNRRYEIDAAELHRVFPATIAQPPKWNEAEPSREPQKSSNAIEIEIRMLREMLDRERETVEDLHSRLTRAELVITDQRSKPHSRQPFQVVS